MTANGPVQTWEDPAEYQKYLEKLVTEFSANFEKYEVSDAIRNAGPKL